MAKSRAKVRVYGRHIVADPAVCHGELTFKGTRILVHDVLEQVAMGMAWSAIEETWGGKVSRQAIAEAVRPVEDSAYNPSSS